MNTVAPPQPTPEQIANQASACPNCGHVHIQIADAVSPRGDIIVFGASAMLARLYAQQFANTLCSAAQQQVPNDEPGFAEARAAAAACIEKMLESEDSIEHQDEIKELLDRLDTAIADARPPKACVVCGTETTHRVEIEVRDHAAGLASRGLLPRCVDHSCSDAVAVVCSDDASSLATVPADASTTQRQEVTKG